MVWCLSMVLIGAGCVTKSKANAQARAAFLAGQQQARQAMASMQSQVPSVWVLGNVKTSVIPWTKELTLTRALLDAVYQGPTDPKEITIRRNGQPPINVDPQSLLRGEDLSLQVGDRIDIKP